MTGANPLLVEWRAAVTDGRDPAAREDLVRRYSFAIPDEHALERARDASPHGILEIGAGTGYWAKMLSNVGVEVVAVDPEPAPSDKSIWFAGIAPWAPVEVGDHTSAARYGDRTLLLVWPTHDETWGSDAVSAYAAAGGTCVVYVGEPPGGRTGDAVLHALLGGLDRCWACAYGITNAACICGTVPLFQVDERIDIPRWSGFDDELRVTRRTRDLAPLGPDPDRRPTARRLRRRR